MAEQTLELRDYLDMIRRRRRTIWLVGAIIFVVGAAAAVFWPATYQSTATVLVQEQEIPPTLVQSTVTSYAAQRIQTIQQRVMTRANLLGIVDKYNLYSDQRKYETDDEILQDMQNDISMNMISADVVDPQTGRPSTATIAFTVGFEGRNPSIVQQVANQLTTLYLNENLKSSTEKASGTYEFLTQEADHVSKKIAAIEAKMAAFKLRHVNDLPSLQQVTLQMLNQAQQNLDTTRNQITSNLSQINLLKGQLAAAKPYSPTYTDSGQPVMDPESQLRVLRTQYLTMSAEYAPDYPDVVKLRREIKGLEKQTGDVDSTSAELQTLDSLRAKLATDRKTYSDTYPDVVKLKKQIAALETSIRKADAKPAAPKTVTDPTNPGYINIQSQLNAAQSNVERLRDQEKDYKAQVADYQKRLDAMPQVEQELALLTREHTTAVAKYQDIKTKQMDARLGEQMEQARKGERFSLIDPPALPQTPVSPNRPAILFLSLILALGGGFGVAFAAESMDTSVRGAKGVVALLSVPPLASIPYMQNREDHSKRRRGRITTTLAIMIGIIAVLAAINYLWMPLDVLWFKALRKINILMGSL
jgi:polysaccharide biosynthesis transport protein